MMRETLWKRFALFCVLPLSFLFAEETETPSRDFGGLFRGEAYGWYIPHNGGPLKIRVTAYSQNGAVLVRIFDQNGSPVLWRYAGVSGIQPVEYDFGHNAPQGTYQVRAAFRGAKIGIRCIPEHPLGIMPLKTWLYAENPDQFKNVWFRFPAKTDKLGFELRSGNVQFRDPEGIIRRGKFLPHNVPNTDELWSAQLSLKTHWDHLFRITTFPAIFAPDKESAEQIGSPYVKDENGKKYAFPFQIRAAGRIRELEKHLRPVPEEDLTKYASLFEDSPRSRYLLGQRGILSCFQRLPERYGKKLDLSGHLDLAAVVWALNRPFNPWYKNSALEGHIVHAALKFLMKIEVTDTIAGRDGWSGSAASGLFQNALAFATAGPLLSPEDRALWAEGIRRIADRYPFFSSSRESYTSRWPLILLMIAAGSGEKAYRTVAEDYVRMLLLPENTSSMRVGYLREGLGCDPWSQGESVLYLALYYRLTGSRTAREGLRRIFYFLNHSVVPFGNGQFVSASNFASIRPLGWGSRRFRNEGNILLKSSFPEAGCWPVYSSGEDQLTIAQLLKIRGGDPAKAVTADAPYFIHWLAGPGDVKEKGVFPIQERGTFIRPLGREFTAVRTSDAYLFLYNGNNLLKKSWIGKHYLKYDGRSRPRNWDSRTNRNWDIIPGLGLAASPQYGPFIVSRSCNGKSLHMLVHDGGKKTLPVYPDFLNSSSETFADGSVKIAFKTRPEGSLSAVRRITPLQDGARISLSITQKSSRSGRLMEQIPFIKHPNMQIVWWKNGKWQDVPCRTNTMRFGNHFYLRFDRAVETVFDSDTVAEGLRTGCLRIPLDEFFPDKGPLEFSYDIRFR